MGSYIGIDLGTTFSALSVIDDTGRPKIVHNEDGQNITPSCVTEKTGKILVGKEALRTWRINKNNAAARFKRVMGTQKKYSIGDKDFTPTELSTFVLKKLVKDAKPQIGNITEAVVTIPANFANEAREATMAAAEAAGLNVNYIINEPTAAALYYAFKKGTELNGFYAVYDLGGGTFDISIIKVQGQDIDVVATNGVSKLGGDDFDVVLQEIVAEKYENQTNEEIRQGDYPKHEAEEDKKSLSKRESVLTKVVRETIEVTRDEFEEGISKYIAQTEMLCESALDEAGLNTSDIKNVFLAGGSTRIPLVRESVEKVFNQEPISSVNVDEIVALGASLYAAYKGDQKHLTAVQKNAISQIKVKEATSKCFGTIAVGVDSEKQRAELQNNVLIKKGESIPCSVTETFYTMHDGQEAVDCKITESTTPETDPDFVKIIWEGELKLPSGRPKGQKIEITYSYDENQIMKCSFVDVKSGEKTNVDLSMGSSGKVDTKGIEKFMVE